MNAFHRLATPIGDSVCEARRFRDRCTCLCAGTRQFSTCLNEAVGCAAVCLQRTSPAATDARDSLMRGRTVISFRGPIASHAARPKARKAVDLSPSLPPGCPLRHEHMGSTGQLGGECPFARCGPNHQSLAMRSRGRRVWDTDPAWRDQCARYRVNALEPWRGPRARTSTRVMPCEIDYAARELVPARAQPPAHESSTSVPAQR